MAYSSEQWERARGYYEAGLPLSKIKEKTGIARNTVSQRAKREQWEHGESKDYVEARELVAVKKGTILEQKGTVVLNAIEEVADDNIRRKNLVYGASEKIVQLSAKMAEENKKQVVMKVKEYSKENGSSESLDKIDVELDASDLKSLSDAVDKASLTLGVNERFSQSQVNIQNNNQNDNKVIVVGLPKELSK